MAVHVSMVLSMSRWSVPTMASTASTSSAGVPALIKQTSQFWVAPAASELPARYLQSGADQKNASAMESHRARMALTTSTRNAGVPSDVVAHVPMVVYMSQ